MYIFSNTAKPWNWEHCGAVPCGEGRASILEKGRILEGECERVGTGHLTSREAASPYILI